MSKLKKVLLMGTAYVLVAALAIGGTIAYLTDTDSDVNVMTMGNVSIAQHEYQRVQNTDGTYKTDTIDNQTSYVLEDFEQGKALLPATDPTNNGAGSWDSTTVRMSQVDSYGGMQVFANPNAQDKFVTVENTGKTDAYVRTLVAIECGDGDASLIGASFHNAWTSNPVGKITVDGNNYYVFEYMYKGAKLSDGSWRHGNGVLPAGDTTYPNLSQVYLKSAATNEDCEALDGNDNGTLDILVLSQAAQTAGFADAQTALDTAFGKPSEKAAEWFGGVLAENSADTWDGTADTTWYNDIDTEFSLTSAEQLAGMNQLIADGETFAGKTITLDISVDMAGHDWVVTSNDFAGTFDGGNNTIYNISRTVNTYTSGRMGLFGHVEGGTIKNVTIDGAAFYGYGPYGAVVAGSAYGECVFENITLKNCNNEMYNTGSAGIVGLAYSDSDYTFKGINIDSSNSIGGYWGTYDIAAGGLIGYFWKNGDVLSPVSVEDCYLAQQMNVYNDVCANYQWYAYRYSGMLIGYVNGSTTNADGTTYPLADTVTCKDVTVEYGDWANYYYCELESNGHPSYAGENDYKFSRLVPISSVDEMSSEEYAWDNHFVLIDGDNVTCYHVTRDSDTREITGYHTHTEAEDNVCVKLTFDQLYGGGQGVYGDPTHDGVTVIYNNK